MREVGASGLFCASACISHNMRSVVGAQGGDGLKPGITPFVPSSEIAPCFEKYRLATLLLEAAGEPADGRVHHQRDDEEQDAYHEERLPVRGAARDLPQLLRDNAG